MIYCIGEPGSAGNNYIVALHIKLNANLLSRAYMLAINQTCAYMHALNIMAFSDPILYFRPFSITNSDSL